MPSPVRYFDLIREMRNAFNRRLRLVTYARQQGLKAAARAFQTTVPTVRKWLRRYQAEGLKGLEELSRAPRSCPHKVEGELATHIVVGVLELEAVMAGSTSLGMSWEKPILGKCLSSRDSNQNGH
jgi:hypothetical protein